MEMIRESVHEVRNLSFVLSDETPDSYDTIIDSRGWDLTRFRANPIALFKHDQGFIIGLWENARVEGRQLIANLKLAARGTSQRIDELISLVEQGIIRGVSVGFNPLEMRPEPGGNFTRIVRQSLAEASLVAIPSNQNALAQARSMNISHDTLELVFGEQAVRASDPVVRGTTTGEHAATSRMGKSPMTLSERIVDAQTNLVAMRDNLVELSGAEALDLDAIEALNVGIEKAEGDLAVMKRTEASISGQHSSVTALVPRPASPAVPAASRRPFNLPRKEIPPGDFVLRAHVVNALAKVTGRTRSEIMAERYGNDEYAEFTQRVYNVVTRAASAPATTTTSGWADTLVQTSIADFLDTLVAASVYPGLSARGLRTGFGRSGTISFPTRSAAGGSLAGAFVAQGAPIPVRQTLLAPVTLGLKKLGVITTFTREIAEHSTPDIENLLRRFISEDTGGAIDAVLVSASAASATAPAGIRNGVSVITATAGGGFAALVGDVVALISALVTSSNGNLRAPTWLMNPIQATRIAMTQNAGGDFVFADQINGGNLAGYPVLKSSTVTAGMLILVDAADFVSATGDDMRFDVSDQATLHMEDTTPLAIGTTGSPAVVAAPTRSLWQTDSLGLRMIMDLNWALLRTGTVAWTQSVTW
jgi:HK97 family phage major capsid protein/HK97 family phage prohead protease